jgi:hypothetical protein
VKLVSEDLVHDVTLRVLSVLVVTSLILCLAYLGFRWFWLRPPERLEAASVPATAAPPPTQRVPVAGPTPTKPAEVLMNPGYAYRCSQGGKVVYSERPCGATAPGQPAK